MKQATTPTKQCKKCFEVRPIEEFTKKSNKDGRSNSCKKCAADYQKEIRLERKQWVYEVI